MNDDFMPPRTAPSRAIVIGASMAGLLAARVLSERYAEVLVFERDALPDGPEPRKGTPHATHAHGLLARGREVLEALFPGFTAALIARGGVIGDIHSDVAFDAGKRRLAASVSEQRGVCCSRLLIEDELRRRIGALRNVRVLARTEVIEPSYEGLHERVTGAIVRQCGVGTERRYTADLVVDATGRGSRVPGWLRQWGYEAPHEERVTVGFGYITAYYERRPEHTRLAGVICAATPEWPYPGALLAQESDMGGPPRWVVTFGAYAGERLAASMEGMRQRAVQTGAAEIIRITHEARPLSLVARYGFPHSQRRRYERLRRFPKGLLVLGDALASFNPVYGQGMTVAACEALALQRALQRGEHNLRQRFFKAAARIVDTPWQLAVGGDLAIPSVQGERPLQVRLVNAYLRRVFHAAQFDPVVARAFRTVTHMLAPPASLFCPKLAARVAWQSLTQEKPSDTVSEMETPTVMMREVA